MQKIALFIVLLAVVSVNALNVRQRLMPLQFSSPRNGQKIQYILIHFSSLAPTDPANPYDPERNIKQYEKYEVSAHYLVDRQGNVIQIVSDDRASWHAGPGKLKWGPAIPSMNKISIGIEVLAIGSFQDMSIYFSKSFYDKINKSLIGYTPAQYTSIKELVASLAKKYGIPMNRCKIVGHSEWNPEKRDPGTLFDWAKIGLPGTCQPKAVLEELLLAQT